MIVRTYTRGSVQTTLAALRWDAAARQFHAADYRLALDGFDATTTQRVTVDNPRTNGAAEFVRLAGLDTAGERVFVCKALRLVLVVELVVSGEKAAATAGQMAN